MHIWLTIITASYNWEPAYLEADGRDCHNVGEISTIKLYDSKTANPTCCIEQIYRRKGGGSWRYLSKSPQSLRSGICTVPATQTQHLRVWTTRARDGHTGVLQLPLSDVRSRQAVALRVHQLAVSLLGDLGMTTQILPAAQHEADQLQFLATGLLLVELQQLPQLLHHLLHLWERPGAVN